MSSGTLVDEKTISTAGMAQIIFLTRPEQARAVVGSCIALTLFHSRRGLGALGHIVLPNSTGRPGSPGKFADTAVLHMVETLKKDGANTAGLVAKICGGASMFGPPGPLQIGKENAEAVACQLRKLGIRIVGEHLAGSKGRRATFDCETGQVTIEIVGKPTEII